LYPLMWDPPRPLKPMTATLIVSPGLLSLIGPRSFSDVEDSGGCGGGLLEEMAAKAHGQKNARRDQAFRF
jgi:hypothetical protein